jgi:hypothetical protein
MYSLNAPTLAVAPANAEGAQASIATPSNAPATPLLLNLMFVTGNLS